VHARLVRKKNVGCVLLLVFNASAKSAIRNLNLLDGGIALRYTNFVNDGMEVPMSQKEVVLVTGVAGYWGGRVAEKLIAEPGFHVIGVDVEQPRQQIKGLDFIQTDIRNPLLVDLLRSEAVDIVCHLAFVDAPRPSESAFEVNVMGTMKVLGACAEVGVRKAVLKSSMAVYGARPNNSAFLTEQHPLRGSRRYGNTRYIMEIEAFCNGFRRQVPEMDLTILRFSSVVGPTVDTPMTRFLKELWTPVLLGFDPMMQIIHERDVVDALAHAVIHHVPGVFNVAAEGVMPLSRLMALAGKVPLPVFHLFAYWGVSLLGGSGLRLTRHVPIELDYIRYRWVGDLRKMREQLDFSPAYTAEETLREFASEQRMRSYMPEAAARAYDEERLSDTLERRRRMREREASSSENQEEEAND
jgi:UDP-glucose 4-epimerase